MENGGEEFEDIAERDPNVVCESGQCYVAKGGTQHEGAEEGINRKGKDGTAEWATLLDPRVDADGVVCVAVKGDVGFAIGV